ncbi:MAG: sodium:calcium antiporter [Anaerolineae bacterium]
MTWVIFFVSSALLVLAAVKLAEYSDTIALRTGLGRLFIGTLLLAGATSLPEFLTAINSIDQLVPDLAAGNMFGSNMFNILLLGVFDVLYWRHNFLLKVVNRHILTAGFALLLVSLAVFFVQANIPWHIGWVGVDSLVLIAVYLGGVYLLHRQSSSTIPTDEELANAHVPRLVPALIGFALSATLLILVMPRLIQSSVEIATITGLGAGFIGTTLVGIVTSLPEVVTCVIAIRLRAYDLAVGNLFGSVAFNMFALGVTDFFYTKGSFLTDINPIFGLVGMLSVILTSVALLNNTVTRRRARFIHLDAIAIIIIYVLGVLFLYQRGLGG